MVDRMRRARRGAEHVSPSVLAPLALLIRDPPPSGGGEIELLGGSVYQASWLGSGGTRAYEGGNKVT